MFENCYLYRAALVLVTKLLLSFHREAPNGGGNTLLADLLKRFLMAGPVSYGMHLH
jgi:hypothetical protein